MDWTARSGPARGLDCGNCLDGGRSLEPVASEEELIPRIESMLQRRSPETNREEPWRRLLVGSSGAMERLIEVIRLVGGRRLETRRRGLKRTTLAAKLKSLEAAAASPSW